MVSLSLFLSLSLTHTHTCPVLLYLCVLSEMAHVSALQSAPPLPTDSLPPATSTPSQAPLTTSTSTPASSLLPPSVNPLLTPLLGDSSNGASSTQSPLASLIGMTKSPPTSAVVAAALQQLQQASLQSPLHSSPSTAIAPTGLRSGTVTARPLNFASPLGRTQVSPAIQPKSQNMAPLGMVVASTTPAHVKSPGTKIVTAQPIPNASSVSMAEILASLQKQPSSIATSIGGPVLNGLLSGSPEVNPIHSQTGSNSNSSALPSGNLTPLTPSAHHLLNS